MGNEDQDPIVITAVPDSAYTRLKIFIVSIILGFFCILLLLWLFPTKLREVTENSFFPWMLFIGILVFSGEILFAVLVHKKAVKLDDEGKSVHVILTDKFMYRTLVNSGGHGQTSIYSYYLEYELPTGVLVRALVSKDVYKKAGAGGGPIRVTYLEESPEIQRVEEDNGL